MIEAKKPRLLMQLSDQLGGYAGITQESQLLFSSFLDKKTFQTTGLIVKDKPYCLRKGNKGSKRNKIKQSSDFILHYQLDNIANKIKPTALDLMRLPFDVFSINLKTTLGFSTTLDAFETRGFEDFLWSFFFSKTLQSKAFQNIAHAPFYTLRLPRTLMHLAGLMAIAYPKLDTSAYDIFLTQMPFPARVCKNTTLVVRYHDAIPIFAPHWVYHPRFHQLFHHHALKANAKKGLFACTSQASRHALLHINPRLEQRSIVIHDLVSEDFYVEEKSRHTLQDIIISRNINQSTFTPPSSFPFLLMVSTIEPRKNHIRLIHAFEMLRHSMSIPLKLIIVGKLGWGYEAVLERIKPWQKRGEIFHLHQLQSSELRFLYQHASCVVCPSLMEGFDLTGIEAMLCGGKVAASHIPVHEEIYGHAAVYFDPFSVEAQADAIESIIHPKQADFATTLSERAVQWGKRYQAQAIFPQWAALFEAIYAGEFN